MMNALELYMNNLTHIKRLPPALERKLFLMLNGETEKPPNTKIKNALIQNNLKLVVKIARYYTSDAGLLIELIQEGNIGLMRAIDGFDINKGYKLSTYAQWWIKHYILKWIYTKDSDVKLPSRLRDLLKKMKKRISREGIERFEDFLKTEDIKEAKAAEIYRCLDTGFCVKLSPDMPYDAISIEDEVEQSLLKDKVRNYLEKLTNRDRMIIMHRFGLFDGEMHSLARIAEKFDLSIEGVRKKILRILQNMEKRSLCIKKYRV